NLTVSVKDRQGNESKIVRRFSVRELTRGVSPRNVPATRTFPTIPRGVYGQADRPYPDRRALLPRCVAQSARVCQGSLGWGEHGEPPGLSRRLDGRGKRRRLPRIEEGRNPCYIEGTGSRAKGDSRSVEAASKAVCRSSARCGGWRHAPQDPRNLSRIA